MNIIQNIKSLFGQNEQLAREVKAAHERIDLLNLRVAQIEHYTGMRKHRFEQKEQRWAFNQVQHDVKQGRVPKEQPIVLKKVA